MSREPSRRERTQRISSSQSLSGFFSIVRRGFCFWVPMSDTTELPSDLLFLQSLIDECDIKHPKPLPGGRLAGVHRKMFTHALLVGRMGDAQTYDEHWCYENEAAARTALDAWDGSGEPAGWVRHPMTGRRVSRSPDERDEKGHAVGAVGVLYVRK